MISRKTYKRILLPGIVVLSAAISVAQVATRGKWMHQWFGASEPAQEQGNDDNRKKTNDDPWKELEQIYKALDGPSVYYSGKIALKDDDEVATIENAGFSCEVNGSDYRYMIDSVEMVYKDGLALNVYHNDKLIIAGKEPASLNLFRVYSNLDSLKKFASQQGAVAEVLLDNGYKVIKIDSVSNSEVYGYEIFYNPADYKVKKVILSLATTDQFDGDTDEAEKIADASKLEDEGDDNAADSTGVPSVELNLYKMEINYDQFQSAPARKDFDPVKKFGIAGETGFQLSDAYSEYRLVWMDDVKKTKKK